MPVQPVEVLYQGSAGLRPWLRKMQGEMVDGRVELE